MTDDAFTYAWTNIDRTADAAAFVAYLDTVSAFEAVQAYKRQTFSLLAVRDGSRLLDVGCGTGEDAIALAELIGTTGHVVGVDCSAVMIEEARQRIAGKTLPLSFEVGDAHH